MQENELIVGSRQLPETVEQKAKYVLFGTDALNAYRAELSAIKKKYGIVPEQYKQLEAEARATAENVLMFSVDIGEYIAEIPKATTNHRNLENTIGGTFLKPKSETISELGFTRRQALDLQTIAKHPEAVKKVIDEAREDGDIPSRSAVLRKIEAEKQENRPHVANNSGENEWYTPAVYVEAARQAMGSIDLDPASSDMANEVVKAARYCTVETDGLSYEWGGTIWMNPPYSSDLVGRFISKLVDERDNYEQAVVLVNNATETEWFRKLISVANAVCFPYGRIRYYSPNGKNNSPLQGQAIVYVGDNAESFFDAFSEIGWRCSIVDL